MTTKIKLTHNQKGFTIVELMVATSVLSVLLLLVTIIMLGIGNLYQKGINQARVQSATRSITDEIGQKLQLKSGNVPLLSSPSSNIHVVIGSFNGDIQAYCFGNTRYSFIKGIQIGSPATGNPRIAHVLWRDTISGSTCAPVDLRSIPASASGQELVPPNSRLSNLRITGSSPYTLDVGIAFGDDDLLISPTSPSAQCRGGKSDRFCATSTLNTVVAQRL